jgi:hypothetical protein
MAKILFVSEKINETSWSLATALKSQNNKVLFLTSRDQKIDNSQNVEVLSYFKKWSTFEALRFLPVLLNARVDIIHFLLDSDRLNPAQGVLTSAGLLFPNTLISTSLLNMTQGLSRQNPVRYLLERSDLVTAPTVEMLAQLRGLNVKNLRQTRGVIPPLIPWKKETRSLSSSEKVQELLNVVKGEEFVVIPLLNSELQSNPFYLGSLSGLARRFFLIFAGTLEHLSLADRKKWEKFTTEHLGPRWGLSSSLSRDEETVLLKKSWGLFLAGQDMAPTVLTHWLSLASQVDASMIVDDRQTRLYPGLWEHKKNAWIFSRNDLKADLEKWIQTGPPALSSNLTESLQQKQDLLDAPLNELHRLYNKALSQKTVY